MCHHRNVLQRTYIISPGRTSRERAQGSLLLSTSRSSLDICGCCTRWTAVWVKACRSESAERPVKVSLWWEFVTNHSVCERKLETLSLNNSCKSLHHRPWSLQGSASSWKGNKEGPKSQRISGGCWG